jgi:hypothetical protein
MEIQGYFEFKREAWQNLSKRAELPLTKQQLTEIKALNDQISLEDVQDVYVPLVRLLQRSTLILKNGIETNGISYKFQLKKRHLLLEFRKCCRGKKYNGALTSSAIK